MTGLLESSVFDLNAIRKNYGIFKWSKVSRFRSSEKRRATFLTRCDPRLYVSRDLAKIDLMDTF